MERNKILSYIGLAMKSGNVVSGEFMTEREIKSGKAALVIVAGDASENTKKNFRDMCAYYKVPIYMLSDKASLGHAMGKEMRASLAIIDSGLAKAIVKNITVGGSN